jgi:DNA-binding NtrC family response regulator
MHDRAGKMAHGVANGAAPSHASHNPSQGPSHGRPHDTADEAAAYATHAGGAHPDALPSFREARREALEAFEHAYLATLYEAVGGDIRQACSLSNLSRARLYELLRKHAIME